MSGLVPPISGQPDQDAAALDGLDRLTSLPDWLAAIAQPKRVFYALIHGIPEFASDELRLKACEARRARLKKDHWTVMYQLTIDGPNPEQCRGMTVWGALIPPNLAEPAQATSEVAFGHEAWRCYLSELRLELQLQPVESELPAIPLLTEPDQARTFLEQSLRAGTPAYHDIHIQSCTPQIMRFKPGSRCTVLYHLAYPAELAVHHHWPDIIVAKTYRGDKGRNAYDGMCALWDSALAESDAVTIAEPLAYLPEMNVLLQGPIRGEQTLQELIRQALGTGTPQAIEDLLDYMRKTAIGLAALHCSEVHIGYVRVWEDELAEVRDILDYLVAAVPQLAGAATPLLKRLEALTAECPPDPPVPAHGTFRPAQVLINNGRIGFIDFDGFCQAEPALDLALFLGKVKDVGLSVSEMDMEDDNENDESTDEEAFLARLSQLDGICEAFLTEYEAHRPVSRQRVMLWETLDILTLVLHSWTKVNPVRLKNRVRLLEHHLHCSGLSIA